MTSTLALLASTFLYQGSISTGPSAYARCGEEKGSVIRKLELHGVKVITSSCAPVQSWGSPDLGYEVQILAAGSLGKVRRQTLEPSLPCLEARDQLVARLDRASAPWIAAFCDSRGLQIDTVSRITDAFHWNLVMATYASQAECQNAAERGIETLAPLEIHPAFVECRRISDTRENVRYRLQLSTFGPQSVKLSLYSEVSYASSDACRLGAIETDRELARLGLQTGLYWCEAHREGATATHLVLDGYPGRISRLEGPRYASQRDCESGIPEAIAHLVGEQDQPIRGRCVAVSNAYRLFIDYLRAPVQASSGPETLLRQP